MTMQPCEFHRPFSWTFLDSQVILACLHVRLRCADNQAGSSSWISRDLASPGSFRLEILVS